MKFHNLAAVAVAALLLSAGAAMAMPGNAPDSSHSDENSQAGAHADENATTPAPDENASVGENQSVNADENATAAEQNANASSHGNASSPGNASDAGSQGPPADMPSQVPDHVTQIHDLIRQFVNGELDVLGEHVSGVTANDDAGNAPSNANASA